jgi:hypothetical protein
MGISKTIDEVYDEIGLGEVADYDEFIDEGYAQTEDLDEHIIDSIIGTLAHKFL